MADNNCERDGVCHPEPPIGQVEIRRSLRETAGVPPTRLEYVGRGSPLGIGRGPQAQTPGNGFNRGLFSSSSSTSGNSVNRRLKQVELEKKKRLAALEREDRERDRERERHDRAKELATQKELLELEFDL
jgi:hypothetical protein